MPHRSSASDAISAETRILDFLRGPDYRPMPMRELLRRLGIPSEEKPSFRRIVKGLVKEGRIERRGNRLLLADGRASRSARAPRATEKPPARRPHGPALRASVLERRVLGIFRHRRAGSLVDPFDPALAFRIEVPADKRMEAVDGDAIVAEIVHPPRGGRPAQARVVEVLGGMDQSGVDVLVVARRHALATEFPEEVLREAGKLSRAVSEKALGRRERFDDPAPVTIDGETARDFDDAVAVEDLPGGGFRLFVHIADVAHFVRPGSALDREARRRGTSVYFPDQVFPMFPEELSNDLCSLRPDENRLVQSAVMDLDRSGAVQKVRFADGVIRSAGRLTYTQVAAALEGGKRVPGLRPPLVPMLESADRLRALLEARRRARGSIDFDLPEPRILLDVEGAMTGITIEPRNRAHRLIEEFMLVANEAVAGFLAAQEAPCLYRVHEKPDPAKIEALAAFVAGFGLALGADPDSVQPRDIQKLLDAAEGRPEYPIIAQVTLRSMKQARYSPDNIGHFGLAAPVYTHFTSPIRRYPDLVVHRLLRAARTGSAETLLRLSYGLEELGESCSRLEREAEAAERELLEWKKISFIRGRVGETFEGIVTGVTRFGLFVQLTQSLVEGLLHVARLGDDRYEFVERRQELRGTRTGRGFRLGDRLRVVLDRVDPVLRRVDLSLAEAVAAPAPGRGRRRAGKERRPAGGRKIRRAGAGRRR